MPPREGPPMERHASRLSRRQFVVGAGVGGLGLLMGCGRLPRQAAPVRVAHIGYLASAPSPLDTNFRDGLHDSGYDEGQNIVIERRYWEGRADRLPTLAAELVRLPVDVIVTWGTPETRAAKNATSTIPIVFITAGDPVGNDLVSSLARPTGNVTGQSSIGPQLTGKRMQLLTQIVPGLARLAVLLATDNPVSAAYVREAEPAAQALGLQLQFHPLRSPDDVTRAFQAAIGEGAEAAMAPQVTEWLYSEVVDAAALHRLPVMYSETRPVLAGGLMAYGLDLRGNNRRAAYYVSRLLKGTKPADLPVEQPMTFDFVVNLKTAQALGIAFPNEILLQVTEVIQ
jgi:putative tryptophan/tyrosine transport system substrate-binding protein